MPVDEANTLVAIRGGDPVLAAAQSYLADPAAFDLLQHEPVADPSALPDTTLPPAPSSPIVINTDGEPQPIAPGDFIIEVIRPGERVRFAITLNATQRISLYASSMTLDSVLRVYSEGGALLAGKRQSERGHLGCGIARPQLSDRLAGDRGSGHA